MPRQDKWHVTVPMLLVPSEEGLWEQYLRLVQQMGADRVLLIGPDPFEEDIPDLEHFARLADLLRDRIAFFGSAGIEVGYWMWRTIGHTGLFSVGARERGFQPLVGPWGGVARGCYCPLDPGFRAHIGQALAAVAASRVGLILLDDDYRVNGHGPDVLVGCFCPLHVKEFCQRAGRELTREQIVREVFAGRPSDLRQTWLEVNSEALLRFAGQIEQAVHDVSPQTRVGLAAAWTIWDSEGLDVPALVTRLAGRTRPFLRVHGAPYWSREPSALAWIVEYSRLQRAWMKGQDVEIIAEGDTWPHTRYHCSAAMLRGFQEGLIACGFGGVLNYALVYEPRPDHELGYVRTSSAARQRYAALRAFFPPEYEDVGVWPVERTNTAGVRVLSQRPQEGVVEAVRSQPKSLQWLSRLGIPLAYGGDEGPVLIFGYSAAGMSDPELEGLLGRGVVVDGAAACWLVERGFDVGVGSLQGCDPPGFEHFADSDLNGRYAGEYLRLYCGRKDVYYRCEPKPGARVVSEFVGCGRKVLSAGTIVYEDGRGRRFCLLPFSVDNACRETPGAQVLLDYARQEQLARCLAWVGRGPLLVSVPGVPDVHVICRLSPDRKRVAIALQNAHLDTIETARLALSPSVAVGSRIELLLPDAQAPVHSDAFRYRTEDGLGYLTIDCVVPAMGLLGVGLGLQG